MIRMPWKSSNIGILKKVIIGYLCVVFIPICVFGTVIYHRVNNELLKDYVVGKQQMIQNAYTNLKVNMTQIEGLYNVMEYNPNIIQYVSGSYESDSEQIYNFVNYIRPLLTYMRNSNPSIERIKIFKSYKDVLSFRPEFVNINEMQENVDVLPKLEFTGKWVYDKQAVDEVPSLRFYQKLYDYEYVNVLGILEITVKDAVIRQFLNSIQSANSNYEFLITMNNQMIYRSPEVKKTMNTADIDLILKEISSSQNHYFYMFNKSRIIHTLHIEELGLKAVVISNANEEFRQIQKDLYFTIVIIIFLLFVLSAIYYFIASSMTKRILKLAKHIRKVDEKNLSPYYDKAGYDEIGFLVSSYNSMILHINDLVNTVHRTEILRQEAAYAALQAQIKPHFLYNTLESLRMMAQLNRDYEVADMCYAFGRLIRYGLSKDNEHTVLQNEIVNIDNYLKICKIRLGDRLDYEFESSGDMDQVVCPKFILQPLVENGIMHGMSNIRKACKLRVVTVDAGDFINVHIIDNGQGIPAERLEQIQALLSGRSDPRSLETNEGGLGISNVHQRVKAFFGPESGLWLESREGEGTTSTLKWKKKERS